MFNQEAAIGIQLKYEESNTLFGFAESLTDEELKVALAAYDGDSLVTGHTMSQVVAGVLFEVAKERGLDE